MRPPGGPLTAGKGGGPFAPDPFTPPGPADDALVCIRLDFPAASGDAMDGVELAAASLAPEELAAWQAFRLPKRRHEWLMGRMAAKEAVRLSLARAGADAPTRRDILVRADEHGRPFPQRLPHRPAVPARGEPAVALSIAHTDGVAVAAASTRAAGIGIDIERLDRRRGDYESAAFRDDERRRLDAGPGEARAERALRLFCAKEAVAKSIGLGLMGSPHNLALVVCDDGLSRVELRAAGRLAEALPRSRDRTAIAWVAAEAGLVIALAQRDAGSRP